MIRGNKERQLAANRDKVVKGASSGKRPKVGALYCQSLRAFPVGVKTLSKLATKVLS